MAAALPPQVSKILFVCTGNSCRSVMAEGLFRKIAKEKGLVIDISSAGTSGLVGLKASLETAMLLENDGVDARRHHSRAFDAKLAEASDLIVVMTRNHENFVREHFPQSLVKTVLLGEFGPGQARLVNGGIPDPIGMGMDFYRNVYGIIRDSVSGLVEALVKPRSEAE